MGWIGGRYTTSNPIAAIRSSSLAAVTKLPCTGWPVSSRPPVDRGNISYHAENSAFGRSTQTWCGLPFVTNSRTGRSVMIVSIGVESAWASRVCTGSSSSRSAAAAPASRARFARSVGRRPTRSSSRAPVSRSFASSVPP